MYCTGQRCVAIGDLFLRQIIDVDFSDAKPGVIPLNGCPQADSLGGQVEIVCLQNCLVAGEFGNARHRLPGLPVRGIFQNSIGKGVIGIGGSACDKLDIVNLDGAAVGYADIIIYKYLIGILIDNLRAFVPIEHIGERAGGILPVGDGRGNHLGGIYAQLCQGCHMVTHGTKEGHDVLYANFGVFRVINIPEAMGFGLFQLRLRLGVIIGDKPGVVIHIVGIQGIQQQICCRSNVVPGIQPVDDLTDDTRIARFAVGLGGIGKELELSTHGFDVFRSEGTRR